MCMMGERKSTFLAVQSDLATKIGLLGTILLMIAAPPFDRRGLDKSALTESATLRDRGSGIAQTVKWTKKRVEVA